jgi:hypothetical protein
MRCALFWDVTQCIVVIPYRHFGTEYLSHLQGPRNPRCVCRFCRRLVNGCGSRIVGNGVWCFGPCDTGGRRVKELGLLDFKSLESLDFLNLRDGTERLSCIDPKELSLCTAKYPRRAQISNCNCFIFSIHLDAYLSHKMIKVALTLFIT